MCLGNMHTHKTHVTITKEKYDINLREGEVRLKGKKGRGNMIYYYLKK